MEVLRIVATIGTADPGAARVFYDRAEAWGVTRFFVRDPFGRLVNILQHG